MLQSLLIMEHVNANILIDMALDLRQLSYRTGSADRILRYMNCAGVYKPTTIVIGQSSYSKNIVLSMGSAFSQTDNYY
jgi:hypothetical protein